MLLSMDTAFAKKTIELPEGWHDTIKRWSASNWKCDIRLAYWVALDLLSQMDPETVMRRAHELDLMWKLDAEELGKLLSNNLDEPKKRKRPGASA